MAMNVDIDTSDLIRVERSLPRVVPPLELQPAKSPFYRGQFPTTAIVNPDTVRNFNTPGIPTHRIVAPQPLTLAGSSTNSTPTVTTTAVTAPQPPAPTISQSLTTIPTGYQFTFLQVKLPDSIRPGAVISSYHVYRSSTNDTGAATVVQTITHGLTNTGAPIVVQDAQPNGVTMFYWVSAVNVSGVESTLTPAQSGTVTSNAGFNSNGQIATSFHNAAVNVNFVPQSSTTLSNDGVTTPITVAANTNQFAPAAISYNSGTVNPFGFGTWFVYADDPQFQGGAVAYQATSIPYNAIASEARVYFGKIKTGGSSSTGGGSTGGTTTGGTGGRGIILS